MDYFTTNITFLVPLKVKILWTQGYFSQSNNTLSNNREKENWSGIAKVYVVFSFEKGKFFNKDCLID